MIRILLSTRLGERRWTQANLARKTGIRPTTINEWYNEMTVRINLEHLDQICEALGCDITDIIVREPNKKTDADSPYKKRTLEGDDMLGAIAVSNLIP